MIQHIMIVEDEPQAARRLETLILELLPEVIISAKLDSVKKSVAWIKQNAPPDLIFLDIQLADGVSFQIFEQCEVKSPVIFITAYDEYALKAFKVNSIDYILKPVDKEDLRAALKKLNSLQNSNSNSASMLASLGEAVKILTRKYKSRFVLKVGEHLRSVEVNDIQYFYSQEKTTFAKTLDGRKHILEYTLDQLEDILDPGHFFRVNRKYILSQAALSDMVSYTNSRIKLTVKGADDNDIIVARERVQEFKDWLDR